MGGFDRYKPCKTSAPFEMRHERLFPKRKLLLRMSQSQPNTTERERWALVQIVTWSFYGKYTDKKEISHKEGKNQSQDTNLISTPAIQIPSDNKIFPMKLEMPSESLRKGFFLHVHYFKE